VGGKKKGKEKEKRRVCVCVRPMGNEAVKVTKEDKEDFKRSYGSFVFFSKWSSLFFA
jgi:hypothetical protein